MAAAASSFALMTFAARIDERLLSLRFISPWRSRIASSIELVRESLSAVASSCATLLIAVPGLLLTTEEPLESGFGWAILVLDRTEPVCSGGISCAGVDGDRSLSSFFDGLAGDSWASWPLASDCCDVL